MARILLIEANPRDDVVPASLLATMPEFRRELGAQVLAADVRIGARSVALLFTDLSEPEPSRALVAHLARAARQHLVAVVTVADPSVTAPATRDPRDAQALYEKVVAQRLLAERRQVLAMLGSRGIITLDLPADRLSAQVVATYLELKSRGRI